MMRALNIALLSALATAGPLAPSDLRVEYQPAPTIDTGVPPRFSYVPEHTDRAATQSAYQIVVQQLPSNTTVWNTGKVQSGASAQIVYGGPALAADSAYTWSVTWFDQTGAASPTASDVFWTGMSDAAWAASGAQWIGCPPPPTLATNGQNQLRLEFPVSLPAGAVVTQARLYVTGIGWHYAYMNGQQLGRGMLEPAYTTYNKRVYYITHDVSPLLTIAPGSTNTLAILLGNGWPDTCPFFGKCGAGQLPWNGTGSSALPSREEMALLTEADFLGADAPQLWTRTGYERRARAIVSVQWSIPGGASGVVTVVSNATAMGSEAAKSGAVNIGTWMCGAGALLADSIYNGTVWNAQMDTAGWTSSGYNFTSGVWSPAVRIAAPGGVMQAAPLPSATVVQEFPAQNMWQSTPGNYVFDLGQNIAGSTRLVLPAPVPAGVTITIRHAESIQHPPYGPQDGNLYYGNLRSASATDVYTTAGTSTGAEVFVPPFAYHGFRYVEVLGLPFTPTLAAVTGLQIMPPVEQRGNVAFPETAQVMNQLQHAIFYGQASNLATGNPSDCPQRDERLGWAGDSALSAEEASYNFDISALYTHWSASIDDTTSDAIDKSRTQGVGAIPAVIPDQLGGYDQDPAWKTVYPTTVYTLWKAYGDTRAVQMYWTDLLAFVQLTMNDINKAGGIGSIPATWGDWCPPPATPGTGNGQGPKPPISYTGGVAFLQDLNHLVELAGAIGDAGNATYLNNTLQMLLGGFNSAWFHPSTGVYGPSATTTDGLQTAQSAALGIGAVNATYMPAVAAALVNDVTQAHSGHSAVGIIGQKYFTRALTDTGNGWLAINVSLQTDYPSFGWAFNHPIEPATTLWELFDAPTEGPGMNSR